MSIYDRMQATATRLLGQYSQGTIKYLAPVAVTGPAWAPTVGTPTEYTLKATANGVLQKFVDGTLVLASDIQIMCAVFDVSPTTSGVIDIDGRKHQIVRVDQIPAAGTPVAWRMFCRS